MDHLPKETRFQGRLLPEENGLIVGYAKLIDKYNLSAPLPDKLSFISQRHRRYITDGWAVFTPRHEPEDSVSGHLTFALRYEGINLPILRQLFATLNPEIIARWVRQEPTGRYSRRAWFLYEQLTGKSLEVPDTVTGNYVDLLDLKLQQVASISLPSRRHRVNNNLPIVNTKDFARLSETNFEDLKAILNKHFEVSDQGLDHLVQYLQQNFKKR